MHAKAKIANLAKKSPDGWRTFTRRYKMRSLQEGQVNKNGESGENWPWIWQIFKLDDKSGLLESGGYYKNGEYDENSETSQQFAIFAIADLTKNSRGCL